MDVILAMLAQITIRVLMSVTAIFVAVPYGLDFINDKKYLKGIGLLLIAAVLLLFKIKVSP